MADARREGKVVWHTVEAHRSGSERALQRIMQELQAGIKNADVVNTSDTGRFVFLKRKGLLAKYTPAGADKVAPSFRDRKGFAWGWRAFPLVMSYNTKQVTGAEAPNTWKDLLDPAGASGGQLANSPIAAGYARDGVVPIFSPTAITSFAPHPNAARLFTDFLFTREMQQALAEAEGLYVDPEEIERRTEEVKEKFVELFGV